ncbi:unnamed protein product [Urochloa decumbens]|uniref:protein-serine/threonine phosphatase n=1 Tax=Urochloa decumbens TaxID=240449 RepID=A0ABC9A789_9POAL
MAAARAAGTGSGGSRRRSVYLTECAPAWGCAATRGRRAGMEDACAAVPRFAEVPVRMLAGARELGALGIGDDDAAALRLPMHLFGVKDECARIEAAGGKVINWNGHRVSGILAMSRSIGDRYVKPFLIPKPEVRVIPRAKDDDCLILASDGLWDVISNEDACKVARLQILLWYKKNGAMYSNEGNVPAKNPAAQAAADYLVRLALMKGSEDNITVTVIDLKPRKKIKNKS